jgi:hypothetical protein
MTTCCTSLPQIFHRKEDDERADDEACATSIAMKEIPAPSHARFDDFLFPVCHPINSIYSPIFLVR